MDEQEEFGSMARSKYIDSTLWETFANEMRRKLIKSPLEAFGAKEISQLCKEFEKILKVNPEYMHQEGKKTSTDNIPNPLLESCRQSLFKKIIAKCEVDHAIDIRVHKTLCLTTDFRSPHEYVRFHLNICVYLFLSTTFIS